MATDGGEDVSIMAMIHGGVDCGGEGESDHGGMPEMMSFRGMMDAGDSPSDEACLLGSMQGVSCIMHASFTRAGIHICSPLKGVKV